MKNLLFYSLILVSLLQSCGTSSNVTSNFALQKRKYTKGWNVKELFYGRQHKENCEAEIQAKAFKSEENDQEPTSVRSNPEEKLTAETTTIAAADVKIEETNNEIQLAENLDAIENENRLVTSSKIEQEQTAASKEKNVDLDEEQNEKKIDYLFRVFFIIGLSIALLTILLTLLKLSSDIALLFLSILFFLDIISLVIVIISLVKRNRYKGIYKESKTIVILTELLFAILSLTALITWTLLNLW